MREFDVKVEGALQLEKYDIFATAGNLTGKWNSDEDCEPVFVFIFEFESLSCYVCDNLLFL